MPISSELFSALEKGGGLSVEKTPSADKPAPQGGGSTFDRLLIQESGGRQFDDSGNVIMSKKKATGIAQVMPATGPEAAKLAGLEWDPVRFRNDQEYNKALGRAYFDKQLTTFGDERKALAAYNAGPGAVARAIVRANKLGGDFLDYLPQETQKYVPAILGPKAGVKPKTPKWADDKAIVRDDGRPGAIAKSDAVRAGPTAGDMAKAFGASALSGVGDMGQGLIGEPLAWLANKAAGTEEFEGQNLLAGVAESIRDDMTEGGKIARQDVPSGDVFQPETWKLPETTGGMLMIGADGLGSLVPSILPFVGQASKAANLAKAAQTAKVAGDFEKASQLAIQAERASRVAKGAGAVGGFAMTGGAAAGEVRQNIERELQGKSHEELLQNVPLYREAFDKTGDARMARQAVANGAAQYATLFAGAMGAVGGGINAKLLEDVVVKRGLSAALGKMSGNAAVRAGVGAGAGAVGEGLQEVSEKMGQNAGENVGMGRPIADNVTRDSFGDFIGGAMIGGPMGGVGGGASLRVKQPVQPVIKQNSPLSNMASVGQAAQANAAAQSSLAIQQQALVEQEAGLDPSQTIADPAAAAQEAVRRRIMAEQQKAAPQQDYSAAEDAENEIGQATGFEQQDQILEFNRLLAEEQASLAEQRGDIAEAQQIRAAEAANREAIRASRARNRVGKPSGSFGQMNEFADLLREEQADIESQRAEVAAKQDQQRQTEALRAQSELESTDARVAAQMAREAEARRRDILGSVIEQGISGVNPVADVANRFSAELMRQGYRDTAPTDAETQSILRAVDVANAREDGPLPSLPNEGDFYAPPKAQRTAPPKAESKPKQQPNRRLTPKEIREYVADGAILNGDTLTLPDGTVLKLKGPQIAAAREAMRKVAPAQVETAPGQANESEALPQPDAPQQVESPAAVSASPAETPDVSTRTDDQLRYLANNGKPGWKEAAQAEMARREGAKPAEFEHRGVRIYPANVSIAGERKQMWGVESSANKAKREAGERHGFGDSLHETREQAIDAADRQIREDRERAEYDRRMEEIAAKKRADDAARKADTINGFLEGKAPNTQELIRKALDKQYRFDGTVMTVRERIESLRESDELVTDSFEEPKIKPMSRVQFNRASQREQDAHEKKMREAGTKTVYTVSGSELGKYAYDYAQHLLTRGTTGEVKAEIRSDLDAAAHEAATSPLNDTPQPTEAQKEAGNYKVGRVKYRGMDISIENPKGSVRSGTDQDGNRWESTMASHYGYFTGTKAADGDHLDVFLTDGAEDAPWVWVIDQKNQDGSFDEHKVVLGPRTEYEARLEYLANYEPGWNGLGAISSMPPDVFKAWAFDGKKKRKPLVYVEPEVTAAEASDTATAQPDPREAYADQKERAYVAKRGGVVPPKAAMAVRIGAYREYDREKARPNPLDVPSDDVTASADMAVDALSESEAKAVAERLGKKPGRDPYATIKAEHPDDIARAIAGDTWSNGKWIPAQQPTHQDPGQPSEPVTPAVVAKSIQKSARNTEFNPAEAKKWLLGEIDKAVANVPAENAELAAELAREKAKTFDPQGRASEERKEFDALRDSNVAKIAKQIGFVTFDVPGDGKFKVMNTADGLNNFRSKVEKSPGFSRPTAPRAGRSMPGGPSLDESIADAKKNGGSVLSELGNAIEIARLRGKEDDTLLDRFKENSGGKSYDEWRAEQEAAEEIAAREEAERNRQPSEEESAEFMRNLFGKYGDAANPPTESEQLDAISDVAREAGFRALRALYRGKLALSVSRREDPDGDSVAVGITESGPAVIGDNNTTRRLGTAVKAFLKEYAANNQEPVKNETPAKTGDSADKDAGNQEPIKNAEPSPLNFTSKQKEIPAYRQTFEQWLDRKWSSSRYRDAYLDNADGDERKAKYAAASGGGETEASARNAYWSALMDSPRDADVSLGMYDSLSDAQKRDVSRHFFKMDGAVSERLAKQAEQSSAEQDRIERETIAPMQAELDRLHATNERTKSGTDAWNQRAKEAGLLEYLIAQLRAGRVSVEDLPARWQGDAAHSSDLASIFTGLSSRGLAKSRAKKAAEAHPRAAQIAYVQDNFLDILTELEDSGIVKINCD